MNGVRRGTAPAHRLLQPITADAAHNERGNEEENILFCGGFIVLAFGRRRLQCSRAVEEKGNISSK